MHNWVETWTKSENQIQYKEIHVENYMAIFFWIYFFEYFHMIISFLKIFFSSYMYVRMCRDTGLRVQVFMVDKESH